MKKQIFSLILPVALVLLAEGCETGGADAEPDRYYFEMNGNGYYTSDAIGIDGNMSGDQFSDFADNPFVSTAEQPVSTFSIDADGASYAIMRRYLSSGYTVNPSSVRIEELLNYFTFDYQQPTGNHSVAINAEVGDCPWNGAHRLLRLGIKGRDLNESDVPQANFVFLVDVSGSMYGNDRLDLLKSGLTELVYQLRPTDRIAIVTYSGEVKMLLESTPARDAAKIVKAIKQLSASGCTAGGEALKMAYEEVIAHYDAACNNRVIMGTDGDFNVGVTNTEALVEMVESYARQGIYLTCLGFGMGNLNDSMMEKISNAGNGTYHYIDSEDEMMKVFVHERERFVNVANDAKCQVTFGPEAVSQYRLIGYENRVMNEDDFTDDTKDAGEIGAGQTITALYEIVPAENLQNFSQVLATFDFRYKKTLDGSSLPLQKMVTVEDMMNKNGRSENFYFAAGVAAFGMVLRDSPHKGDATLDMAIRLVKDCLSYDPHGYRADLLKLMERASETE